jgi:peptidoglycan DL-endopeptidase RipA
MRRMTAAAMVVALVLSPPGRAVAQPDPADPNTLADLIVAVAKAEQDLQELGASIEARRESVNKAIVEVQNAQKAAGAAKSTLDDNQQALADTTDAIAAAQRRFDEFAAAAYVYGPPASYLTAASPEDLISTGAYGRALTLGFEQTQSDLQKARTEQLNRESAARSAQADADQAVADAKRRQDDAVATLADVQQGFVAQQAELTRLVARRDAARARLAAVSASERENNWALTLPTLATAFLSGDPASVIAAILQMSGNSEQVTAEMGRNFLSQIGIRTPADSGINNGRIPAAYGRQASEWSLCAHYLKLGSHIRGAHYRWA